MQSQRTPADLSLEATLSVGPDAPGTARAAMAGWLTGHVPVEVLDDALLLTSELVANSLGHADLPADASLRVAVRLTGGALRIEVRDPGRAAEIVSREPDRFHGGGFGLHLVDQVATRWGVTRAGGTEVWFEMDAMGATG